ncbi:MAG: carboxyl transferase domain-containing protein [Pseudomonadota bacterium]
MAWTPELDELKARESYAQKLGGEDKIVRQHNSGRLTVRERIDALLDAGSFHEIGALAGAVRYDEAGNIVEYLPSNCVMGRGLLDGRPVVVTGDDFTVRGGAADATIHEKSRYPEAMARDLRLPIVRLVEGSGGGGSVRTIELKGRSNLPGGLGQHAAYDVMGANLATVPVVALGLGSVAGLGAARLAASHYSVMVKDTSAVFVAGPPVVEHTGEQVDKQTLGGHDIQTRAGGVDDAVDSEAEAFQRARQFLSYLPTSVFDVPPRATPVPPPRARSDTLFELIPRDPRKVYRMRKVVEAVVDDGSFFEMGRMFGRPMITGLARVDGWPVALMASDPMFYGGAWTADACEKLVRFVDLAETFHLPIVYLADCPGFMVGTDAERNGTIRKGVRALTALNQTSVPWCTFIVRNAFGIAGGAHRPVGRYSIRYAWLTARWGSLPLQGGIEAAYRAELDASADPAQTLGEIEARLERLRSPFRTAETFWVEEMIDPRATRDLLVEFAGLAAPLREAGTSAFGMRP